MFIQHKQLKVLNVPATKVARLNSSGCNVQMAFPGFPPQMCAAYLVSLTSGNKVLVVVAFYLSESRQSIFFVPKRGEVSVEEAEGTFEQGFIFAETMGFVLNETDYHLLSAGDQQKLWSALPICRLPSAKASSSAAPAAAGQKSATSQDPLDEYRERSLKSLGRFLSSM
jgi:hypothetical protein